MQFLTFVCILVLIHSVFLEHVANTIKLVDDKPIKWSPTSSETIELTADAGYEIQVDVIQLALDGENNDCVTIKSINEDGEETDLVMFTYTVSGKPSYLFTSNIIKAEYVGSNSLNSLVLQFTRSGEPLTTTTTIITTSVEPMPTPSPKENATLTVYLYGLAAESYTPDKILEVRKAIANMGKEYCDVQNCPLNGTITESNVEITRLIQCSVMWEQYDACVVLSFALPIIKPENYEENSLWNGYQLSESHLRILWRTYGSKYMGQIELSLYSVPDINRIFTYKIVFLSGVTIVLTILLLFMRYLTRKLQKRRRKLSDTICIIDRQSDRISEQSLPPHYLQELPPNITNPYSAYPDQRIHVNNFSDFNKKYAENDEEDNPVPQPFANQFTISNNNVELEDADA